MEQNAANTVEPKSGLEPNPAPRANETYTPPQITVYGTIAELTNGSAGALNDLPGTRAA